MNSEKSKIEENKKEDGDKNVEKESITICCYDIRVNC